MTKRDLSLELPIIALILGFTAVPMGLKPIDWAAIEGLWGAWPSFADIAANVLLYVPLGIVCAWRGVWSALLIAAGVSLGAEAIQFLSALRAPSLIDVLTNVAGDALGVLVSLRWRRRQAPLALTRPRGVAAAVLAVLVAVAAPQVSPRAVEHWLDVLIADPPTPPRTVNSRGAERPGRLEAHWTFDADTGGRIDEVGPNVLIGLPINSPPHIPGVAGAALQLNGEDQYVVIGDAPQLRLSGSMTISAWINAGAFPEDDAAIVSSLDRVDLGYQLDTTVDEGARTISLKISSADGRLMARYGRTVLQTDRWYHVAGVYDARARTLDVYLNGRRENGCLLGVVGARQRPSDAPVVIGRRAEFAVAHFAGAVDDVRVYSRALSAADVAALFQETRSPQIADEPDLRGPMQTCGRNGRADPTMAGLFVLLGQLLAFALVALWAGASRYVALGVALAAGLALIPLVSAAQPLVPLFFPPLLALAGAASVIASLRSRQPQRV